MFILSYRTLKFTAQRQPDQREAVCGVRGPFECAAGGGGGGGAVLSVLTGCVAGGDVLFYKEAAVGGFDGDAGVLSFGDQLIGAQLKAVPGFELY